jgi:ATP-dependent helicase HrpB
VGEAERRALVERVCRGGLSYKDIKDQPVWPAVRALLAPEQHAALERHAPERLRLANGRTPALHYAADGPPHVALRVQELYGLTGAVRIAQGRVTVLFHVLAPNQRPVQITSDLSGFWEKDYPRVKNELQRKYPKHEWR